MKLPAGDIAVYPGNSLQDVTQVTRGYAAMCDRQADRRRRPLAGTSTTTEELRY
ncbi:MAG: hypothetical protein WBW74_19560 [Xanthobacteraceae bacterium]